MTPDPGAANGRLAVSSLRRFLAAMGIPASEQATPEGVAFHLDLEGPAEQAIAQVLVEAERFVLHFIFSGYVPPPRRPAMAEFIARANWGSIEGSFELDLDTGALRYRIGLDFTGTPLTDPLLRNALLDGMETVERLAADLVAVAEGRAPAAAGAEPTGGPNRLPAA